MASGGGEERGHFEALRSTPSNALEPTEVQGNLGPADPQRAEVHQMPDHNAEPAPRLPLKRHQALWGRLQRRDFGASKSSFKRHLVELGSGVDISLRGRGEHVKGQLGHDLLQRAGLATQVLDLVRCRGPGRAFGLRLGGGGRLATDKWREVLAGRVETAA